MTRARILVPLTSLALLVGVAAPSAVSPAAAAPAQVVAKPASPSSVAARPVGRTALSLTWPAVAGAASYELYAKDAVTGAVTGPVFAAGVQGEVPGLTVGRKYVPGVLARNAAGASAIRWGTATTVLADGPPMPVSNVQATASTSSTSVRISWTVPTTGIQPDAYGVGIATPNGTQVGDLVGCDHPCTSVAVAGLEPGTYVAAVAPVSWSGGAGMWVAARSAFTVVDGCAAGGACVTVVAGSDNGDARLRAQGVTGQLRGMGLEQLRALRIQNVRGASAELHATAKAIGARMTWLLSNDWRAQSLVGAGRVLRPWDDWNAYGGWVQAMATGLRAIYPSEYIDVQNEPYVAFFPEDPNMVVGNDVLADQIRVASEAIRRGDPAAKVVAPAFGTYVGAVLRSFLDESVERGIRLDALAWHELDPTGTSVNHLPSELVGHVDTVRTWLAERPSLGQPEIHINEYGNKPTNRLAGWTAGFIAAVEQADVDVAMRTCFTSEECAGTASLTDPGTGQTLAPYWVHRFYADQTGRRLASGSTNSNVSTFATRDGDTVRVLVGRHQSCLPGTNPLCTGPRARVASSPAYAVPVQVLGLQGGASRRVVIQRIPATNGPVAAPITVSDSRMTVAANGTLTINLPTVADGEAWTVTVSR